MCDQISDAVLDALLAEDPNSRVALETLAKTGLIVLAGEITTSARPDFVNLARKTALDIGYDNVADRLRRQHVRGADRDRAAIARHLPGRHRRPGSAQGTGRRRPGPDVRLCLRRDAGADAAADRAGASADGESGPPAQGERSSFLRPDAQKPGHGALRRRPSGRRHGRGDLDPAHARMSTTRPSARRSSRS